LVIAVACLVAGVVIGVIVGWSLASQRHNGSDTMAQLNALNNQLIKFQQEHLEKLQGQMESASKMQTEALEKQMAALQSSLTNPQPAPQMTTRSYQFQVHPGQTVEFHPGQAEAAAADSVEGKLCAEGKTWERAQGEPAVGDYVQDTLTGRADQPAGRGHIGKVLSVAVDDRGASSATVDFGRGCVEGIMFSELAPIHFTVPEMR
jgi:uncharacterized membrane-anchored protein YhcB (DUF1043 family)